MTELWELAGIWPLRVILAAGGILLIGRVGLSLFRQPSRRVIVGMAAVLAALLVVPLSLLPGWLPITISKATQPAASSPKPSVQAPEVAFVVVEPQEQEREFVFFAPEAAEVPPAVEATPQASETSPMVPSASATSSQVDRPIRLGWTEFVWIGLVAYALISLLLVSRLLLGQLALRSLWRRGHSVPEWAEASFRELANTRCPSAQLRQTSQGVGPICFGIIRPRVLIPSTLLVQGDSPSLRCIFAHELGHLNRRDPSSGWFLGLANAAFFVWPWLIGLRREIRFAQECLADAEAARLHTGPTDYAELLLRLTRSRPAPMGAAGVRGTHSELFRRITMLVQKSGSIERRCPRRWLIAFGSGLTALAVLVTGLTIKSETAKAAIPPKNGQPAPAEKPAEVKDPLKEALEKIKKDLGDDPAAAKQVEELLKTLQQKEPAKAEATAPPPPLPAPPALPPLGQVDPAIGDLMQLELELRKQMEQALGQLRGAGFGAGFGGPGVRLRPVGPQPFPGAMSQGRLGVRVEAPNEVLTSQLNIPNGTGLVVFDVPAQSPAGKIGIMPHDILLEVAGKPVPNQVVEFVQNLKEVKETDPIDIVLLRKGKKETLKGVKLPEVKELPRPVQPRFPQVPGARVIPIPQPGAGVAVVPPPPVNVGPGESVRVEQVNDAFTVFYAKNGVKLTVSGSKNADGKAIAESIEIEDEGKTTKVESFEKLPKEYQELAKKALGSVK